MGTIAPIRATSTVAAGWQMGCDRAGLGLINDADVLIDIQ